MRGLINDLLRWIIGVSIAAFGVLAEGVHRFRIYAFSWIQARLRWKYRVGPDTPILCFGPELERRIREAALHA